MGMVDMQFMILVPEDVKDAEDEGLLQIVRQTATVSRVSHEHFAPGAEVLLAVLVVAGAITSLGVALSQLATEIIKWRRKRDSERRRRLHIVFQHPTMGKLELGVCDEDDIVTWFAGIE